MAAASTLTKQQLLDEVRQKILDNKVTPELAEGATQLVFGEGNPESEVVFIGEAPGKQEDIQGKPFVGASGKFLNEMLEISPISLNTVRPTTATRCLMRRKYFYRICRPS